MTISVIIPICKNESDLSEILKSLSAVEVVLIDNGAGIEIHDATIKVIRNEENKGAAYARNQGVEASCGEYVIFMDCDVVLDEGFLDNLRDVLSSLPKDVMAISPKILNADSERIFSCGLKITPIYRSIDIRKEPFDIDGPNSCCAIFRRSALEELKDQYGYFDERFFFMFEDSDLALRMKKNGMKALYIPELVCHHEGGSSGHSDEYRRYLCFRNRWYMVRKHNKGWRLAVFLLRSCFYELFRGIHFVLTNKYFLQGL